jgi:hypothetical protein
MSSGRRGAVGLSAAFVLLTACCALPTPPGEEDGSVVLLSEEPGMENIWFHAMEDGPNDEQVIGQSDVHNLGESSTMPSNDEEMSGVEGERGSVKGETPPPKEPTPVAVDQAEPDEVRNPYGQMLADLQAVGKSQEEAEEEKRRYDKLQYYDASVAESDAVQEAITTATGLMVVDKPDPGLEAAATAANEQLVEAVDHRRKLENDHAEDFANKDYKPVPDKADESMDGPFTKVYRINMQMKRAEEGEAKMQKAFQVGPMADKTRRALYPNKKIRSRERADEDIYYRYTKSSKDYKPQNSRAFSDAKKKQESQMKLMDDLQEAAKQFQTDKLSNQLLSYKTFVAGTPLEGITNFFALTTDEVKAEVEHFKLLAEGLKKGEFDAEQLEEQYIQKFDEDTKVVPFDEWAKKWNMERMVNDEVPDPDYNISEKQIKEDAEKLYQERNHPDLEKDIETVQNVKKTEQELHDMNVAHIVSLAPKDADFAQMKKEKVVGAEQLEADTKMANLNLEQQTAHPDHYGPNKALRPDADPDYEKVDQQVALKESNALEKKNQKALLVDAKKLAETGSRADHDILKHDEKMALDGKPAANADEKQQITETSHYYTNILRTEGNQTMQTMKEGIKARLGKEMKAWDKMKGTVLMGGVSPGYGAEALKSLPSRSGSPELEGNSFTFEGNSQNSIVPLRMDDAPNDGSSQMPSGEVEAEAETSQQKAGSEPRPRTGYPQDDEDTPATQEMTAEQVAEKQVEKDDKSASAEAADVEGVNVSIRPGDAPGASDKEAEKQLTMAKQAEDAVENTADTKKAAEEMHVDPKKMTTVRDDHVINSDKDGQWKAAADEINDSTTDAEIKQPASQSEENSGDQETTENGVPVR